MSRLRVITATALASAVALVAAIPAADAAPAAKKCHPSYKGACLKKNAGDYDCAGGSGDGPNYVRGPVRVVGSDPFKLDRDKDGIACEK